MSGFNSFLGGLKAGHAAYQRRQSAFNASMMPGERVGVQDSAVRPMVARRRHGENAVAAFGVGTQNLDQLFAGLDTAQRQRVKVDLSRKGQVVAALSSLPVEQQAIGIQTYGKDFGLNGAELERAATDPVRALAKFSSLIREVETMVEPSEHQAHKGKALNYIHTAHNRVKTAHNPEQVLAAVTQQANLADNAPENRRGYSPERLLDQLFGAERTTIDSGEEVFDPQFGGARQKFEEAALELSKSDALTAAGRAVTHETINYLLEKGNVTPDTRAVLSEFVNGEDPGFVVENAKPLSISGIDLIGPTSAGARSTIDHYISETNERAGREFLKKPHLRLYNGPTEALSELLTGNNGDYYKRHFSEAIKAFRARDGGVIKNGKVYTEFVSKDAGSPMLLGTVDRSLSGQVDLSDVVGTFTYGVNIIASDDRLNFYVRNNSTVTSYMGANATGLEIVWEASPGNPLSAVSQIFTFSIPNPYLK